MVYLDYNYFYRNLFTKNGAEFTIVIYQILERAMDMIIGYARVSTAEQNLDRQIDALQNYGVEELYQEKMTGTKADRPELEKVKLRLRKGDTLVIESLSRLGRRQKTCYHLLMSSTEKGLF